MGERHLTSELWLVVGSAEIICRPYPTTSDIAMEVGIKAT